MEKSCDCSRFYQKGEWHIEVLPTQIKQDRKNKLTLDYSLGWCYWRSNREAIPDPWLGLREITGEARGTWEQTTVLPRGPLRKTFIGSLLKIQVKSIKKKYPVTESLFRDDAALTSDHRTGRTADKPLKKGTASLMPLLGDLKVTYYQEAWMYFLSSGAGFHLGSTDMFEPEKSLLWGLPCALQDV